MSSSVSCFSSRLLLSRFLQMMHSFAGLILDPWNHVRDLRSQYSWIFRRKSFSLLSWPVSVYSMHDFDAPIAEPWTGNQRLISGLRYMRVLVRTWTHDIRTSCWTTLVKSSQSVLRRASWRNNVLVGQRGFGKSFVSGSPFSHQISE